MFFKNKLLLAGLLLSTVACAHNANEQAASVKQAEVVKQKISYCKEPRPQMCTMDYTPVCALVDNKTVKTYGNACSACGDKRVSQHVKGECQADSIKLFGLNSNAESQDDSTKKKSNY